MKFKCTFKIGKLTIPLIYIPILIIQLFIVFINADTIVMDFFSLILIVILLIYMFKTQPELYTKYLYFFFAMIWAVIAVYMMENGTVSLRGRSSEHYGSLPLYILSWMFFICTVSVLERKNERKLLKKNKQAENNISKNKYKIIRVVCVFQILLASFCFMQVAKNPYYLLAVDRFGYQQLYLSSTVNFLLPILYALIPVPLCIVKRDKVYSIIYILLLVLIEIFIGEKFSGLLLIIYFIVLATSSETVDKYIRKNIRRIAIIAFAAVLLLLLSVYIQEVVLNGYSIDEFVNYLQDRIAAQGELWWLAYQKGCGFPAHFFEIVDEVKIWIFQPTGKMIDWNFGIYKMMKLYMNSSWVNYALGTVGARAAESTRVSFLYYGGVIGLLLGQIFLGIIASKVINGILRYKTTGNVNVLICYTYILKNFITAFSMSDFQLLTTKKAILAYFLIALFSRKTKLSLLNR